MPPTDGDGFLARYGPLGTGKQRRQLGRSITLQPAGGRTRAEVLVFAGAGNSETNDLCAGDALASACTLTTAILQQGVPSNEPDAVIEGSIEWGTDGTSQSARFDWRNGGTIVVAGSSFKLSAELLSIPEERTVDVAAFIAYYPVRCCEARLTRVASAPSSVLLIPPMAHAVLPLVDDAAAATLQFTSDRDGAIPLLGPLTYPAGAVGATTPARKVPPGAAAVVVTTAAAAMAVAFELSM